MTRRPNDDGTGAVFNETGVADLAHRVARTLKVGQRVRRYDSAQSSSTTNDDDVYR